MNKCLYKYAGPGNIDKIFCQSDTVSLKCSYPKDFNDPYELFLAIDYPQKPQLLAFYEDVIGGMPQLPTTCFSRSPAVIPMWAHYGDNQEGFVLEIDEKRLGKVYGMARFEDITYRDSAPEDMNGVIAFTFELPKPRYVLRLHNYIFSTAYFTKNSCWAYEMERRMVAQPKDVREVHANLLLDIPHACVKSITAGSRASEETRNKLRAHSVSIGCRYQEMRIGRSTGVPFFVDSQDVATRFVDGSFKRVRKRCSGCSEPISGHPVKCSWCGIREAHRSKAAEQNSLRMLAALGLLEDYLNRADTARPARRSR